MSEISPFASAQDKKPHHILNPVLEAFAGSEPRILPAPLITHIGQNEILFCQGDPANHIYEVVEGVMRLYRLLPDGRRAIAGFLYPGDIVGLSSHRRYAFSAEAITAAKIRRYARSQVEAAAHQSPGLSAWLVEHMRSELATAMDHMLLLGRKSACERVASFLLTIAQKTAASGRTPSIALPMSRVDIGDYLGLTLETVSRVLAKLKTACLIALPTPHNVSILQYDALRELAGQDEDDLDINAPLLGENGRWAH